MPQPPISSQPLPLQTRHARRLAVARTQEHHVDLGRRLGEREVRRPEAHADVALEELLARSRAARAFRSAKLTSSSTTRPSTWWNIGVCVASESRR